MCPSSTGLPPDFPGGLIFGTCYGVSVGDDDSDSWVDVYVNDSGRLWRNVNGATWLEQARILQQGGVRYESAFADYNLDGRTEIAAAPYDLGMLRHTHIFRGEPGGGFFDITTDPILINVIPRSFGETLLCLDAEIDTDLDLLVPGYPPWLGGVHGNWFLRNLGPTEPGGAYRFSEEPQAAGLSPPPRMRRAPRAQTSEISTRTETPIDS
ncbi:MAG: hypothetical protein ACI835_000194 [Planctomycetota bacterium]|jgi:hypothetical protein